MRLVLVEVEPPGHERFDHHVVRFDQPAVGVVVHDPDRGILLLWRHRFAVDAWGWELPAGRVEPGEALASAARREALEETGWEVEGLEPLVTFNPASGVSDLTFHVFLAGSAALRGEPSDPHEADRVEWVPVDQVRRALAAGTVREGMAVAGLSYAFATGRLDRSDAGIDRDRPGAAGASGASDPADRSAP